MKKFNAFERISVLYSEKTEKTAELIQPMAGLQVKILFVLVCNMMSSTVWLVRHAHRLDFIQPEWFETAPYPYDPPLSALGWQQSLELVAQLQTVHIQKIFTSPYLRTLQTAYPLAKSLGLSIQIEAGLREWLHPGWSLALPVTLPAEDLEREISGVNWQYVSQIHPTYPETAAELAIRTNTVADRLIARSNQSVLIVAHKHTLIGIIAALTGDAVAADQLALEASAIQVLTAVDPALGNWKLGHGAFSVDSGFA